MVPQLGMAGHYILKPPFTVDEEHSLVCRGISYIQSLIDKGIDVYSEYYSPAGISIDDYNLDVGNDVAIVTLKDKDGVATNVPSSFITHVPIDLEMPYQRYSAILEFGFLPEGTDLSFLIEGMKELSRTTIGLEPEVALAVLPYEGFVTKTEHVELEQIRETNLEFMMSDKLALKDALDREAQLKQRIEALEDIIIKLQG